MRYMERARGVSLKIKDVDQARVQKDNYVWAYRKKATGWNQTMEENIGCVPS